jgi:hypothetical protein
MYFYYQQVGGEETWKPVPASQLPQLIADKHPMFVTALAVNKLVEDLAPEQRDKLSYEGPFYIDWDHPSDPTATIEKVQAFISKLEAMQFDPATARWYITGGKGFHCEIPTETFMEKAAKGGVANLPVIYKEMVFELYVDTMDLRVYSQGRGRSWRQPNVVRENGRYKVQVTPEAIKGMTPEQYIALCSEPRELFKPKAPELCIELAVIFARAQQKVEEKMKARGKRKRDPNAKERAMCPSIQFMMSNIGLKPGVGFHELAMQIAVIAREAGRSEEEMLADCAILIDSHGGDGNRYNTPAKRKAELVRMHRYMADNPMYDFSIGAVKSLLSHAAPDLDGIAVDTEDLKKDIAESTADAQANIDNKTPDEFNDVAGGVTLSNFGIYVAADDGGKKRVCAVSFKDIHLLMSMETGQLAAYEADVLVNGKSTGRQTLEMEVFMSLPMFNRFCARLGHAFQGSETHLRGAFMRFIELAKKKGRMLYIAKREGLDILNIPNHENPKFREPFMVWADGRGVVLDPRVRDEEIDISFQGFPDPRGIYKTDIGDAPKLTEWVQEEANSDSLRDMLTNMMTCQKADVISKLIGWYTACFYRMPFHKVYGKFPLLHVNGAAGAGKTEMNQTMAHLFFYNQEPKMLTPQSSVFAIQQHASGSVSVPLLIDEYKPHEMPVETHNKLKLLFRDAYNCRDVTKGGGNRESDDYRSLSHTQLAAPMAFIAEAAEEEAAVAERVVLVTVIKPSSSLSLKWLARYQAWRRNKHLLAILGQYLATEAIQTTTLESFRDEFDAMYEEARRKYMLTEHDLSANLDEKTLADKQGAKERSVFNFTVARFGLLRFKRLIDAIFGEEEFAELFKELDEAVYTRMSDLQPATQAEWAKVLDTFATMSYAVDGDSPYALRASKEYMNGALGGRNVVEISMLASYLKYRGYMKSTSSRPLFSGAQSFLHAIKDSPAFIKSGHGEMLDQPGVFTFDVDELAKLRVGAFKG